MGKRNLGTAPSFEAMEERMLLSVTFTPNSIKITGDPAGGNTIVIADDGTSFTVTGAGDATGTAPLLTNASNVKITVNTGNGPGNTVTYDSATTVDAPLKQLTMTGGSQDDTLIIDNGFITQATIKAGNGANVVQISTATINGNLAITTGSDADDIVIGETASPTLPGNVSIKAGNGANTIEINTGDYGTPAAAGVKASTFAINGGKDADTVNIDTATLPGPVTFEGQFSANLGAGNDAINVNATDEGEGELGAVLFNDTTNLNTGDGDDVVSLATFVDDDASPVTFAGYAGILLGNGNDTLNMASGAAGNNVAFQGANQKQRDDCLIDLGNSDTTTGDTLNIASDGAAASVLFGNPDGAPSDDDITLRKGLKTATNACQGGTIQYLAGCDFDLFAVRGTTTTMPLRTSFAGATTDPLVQSVLLEFGFQSEI